MVSLQKIYDNLSAMGLLILMPLICYNALSCIVCLGSLITNGRESLALIAIYYINIIRRFIIYKSIQSLLVTLQL